VFRATETAEGSYVIRFVEPKTFLRDDFSDPIRRQLGEDVEVQVVSPNGGTGSSSENQSQAGFEQDGGLEK
jgi:hypothetical protein